MQHIATAAPRGTYSVGQRWPQFSEEWEQLVAEKPFRSVYEEQPHSRQPLFSKRPQNLSQTPREQCELERHVLEGLERDGPGQVGSGTGQLVERACRHAATISSWQHHGSIMAARWQQDAAFPQLAAVCTTPWQLQHAAPALRSCCHDSCSLLCSQKNFRVVALPARRKWCCTACRAARS